MREKERAEKAAQRAAMIKSQNTKKAAQKSQPAKRKASQATSQSNKRQKRVVDKQSATQVEVEPSAPLPRITSRGRNVKLPSKFR